jgi:hypothetical protein
MAKDRWTEHLRCPSCGNTGDAEFSQIGTFENSFDVIPAGFKIIATAYGNDLRCDTCDAPPISTGR